MSADLITHTISRFTSGRDVPEEQTYEVFEAIVGCSDGVSLKRLLAAWNAKGFTADELFNFATVMRGRMLRVETVRSPLVDIVGTGGATSKTFNVSTAAALITAGADVAVAKHGNRAATSRTGSADAIDALGIRIDSSPAALGSRMNRDGICFLFAPNHHSLSATLAAARRELGQPTIFNCLGPLCNPASPPHSVIGVSRGEWMEPMAAALSRLGTKRSWIVFGECGLDEIAPVGRTLVAEVVSDHATVPFAIDSSEFGVPAAIGAIPIATNPVESAAAIVRIVTNSAPDSSPELISLLNAAAAIYVAGATTSLSDAFKMATESVRTGAAEAKLQALREEI